MNSSNQSARLRPFRPQPFGRYTLLSHLATGGMGEIYLARLEGAQGFEKLCVIKKILPQLAADTEFVERFVGEARTLVHLSHGSIAQVLDMGVFEGEAYMALEHVDGKDLRKVAARVRDRQMPLPLTFILFVMGRVLDALAYAHRKRDDDGEELRLVHRDISPQNILISYEGEVKVIDFGLAKSRLSAAKTNPSIILGKFLYMSPEQARHQPVDRRSDLYAVGLCLYELICGKNPFDSLHPSELMTAVANPKVPPLDEVEPLTPRPVTALVAKALAVEPSQRFQTAEEFRGRLQTCLMEIDASAGPESVSRFMRELFAADFQSERRLLASLKEVPRVPAGAPAASPEEGAPGPRATLPAMLAPKTILLDGPVEPLSFRPTPRSREDNGPVSDGETRPGVMVDESTRPAFPLEALEEEARARAARQQQASDGPSSSVEVRPEAYVRSGTPEPAVPPPPRPASLTREVPMAVLPPEAIPPAPEPRPAPADARPTELALPSVAPRSAAPQAPQAPQALEMPWEESGPGAAPLPPVPVEPTEPRGEPLRGAAPAEVTTAPSLTLPSATPQRGSAEVTTATGLPLPASMQPRGLSEVTTATGLPLPPSMAQRPAVAPPPAVPPAPGPFPQPAASQRPAVALAPSSLPQPAAPQRPAVAPPPAVPSAMGQPPPPIAPLRPAVAPAPAVSGQPPSPAAPLRPAAAPPSAARPGLASTGPRPAVAPVPPSTGPAVMPPRTGAVMMPAVNVAPPGPPQRTLSMTAMPAVVAPAASAPPARAAPVPSAEPDVVQGYLEPGGEVTGELSAPEDVPGTEESELPVVTPDQLGYEDPDGLGELDTNPRISVPSRETLHEDTQPRVVRESDTDPRATPLRSDDTQPRVVLDEALLRDVERAAGEQEEKSNPSRPRTAARRPRTASSVGVPVQSAPRRTGSIAAVRPAPPRVEVSLDEDEDADVRVSMSRDETRRTAVPMRPNAPAAEVPAVTRRIGGEDPRRAAAPAARAQRPMPVMMAVGLLALLLLAAMAMLVLSPGLRVGMGLESLDAPPPPPSSGGGGTDTRGPRGSAPAPAAAPEARAEAPAPQPAPVVAAVPAVGTEGGLAVEPAKGTEPAVNDAAPGTAAEGATAEAAPAASAEDALAKAAAEVPTEAPSAAGEQAAEDEVLALLQPPEPDTRSAPGGSTKRGTPRKAVRPVVRSTRDSLAELTQLQREWRETNALYLELIEVHDCAALGIGCTRYKDVKRAVEAAGDSESRDTLKKVRELNRFLKNKKQQLEY